MQTIVVQGLPFEVYAWHQRKLAGMDFWIEHDGEHWLLTGHRIGIVCASKRAAIELLAAKLKEAVDRIQTTVGADAQD